VLTDHDPAKVIAATATDAARGRAERIREGIHNYLATLGEIAAAYAERDWVHLGYASWDAYVDGEFGAERLRLPAGDRQQAVTELRLAGMSQRAIASTVGVNQATVSRDLAGDADASPAEITGTDGKNYPASLPLITRKVPPKTEIEPAEVEGEVEDEFVAAVLEFGAGLVPQIREMAKQGYSCTEMPGRVAAVHKLVAEEGIPVPGDGPGYYTFRAIRMIELDLDQFFSEQDAESPCQLDVEHLDQLDAAVVKGWVDSLSRSHQALGRLIGQMKGRGTSSPGGGDR